MIEENNKLFNVMVLSKEKCFDDTGKEYNIAQYHRFKEGDIALGKLVWQYQILSGVNAGNWFICADYIYESRYRISGVHNTRQAILLP